MHNLSLKARFCFQGISMFQQTKTKVLKHVRESSNGNPLKNVKKKKRNIKMFENLSLKY
jgi:hypothetical protein